MVELRLVAWRICNVTVIVISSHLNTHGTLPVSLSVTPNTLYDHENRDDSVAGYLISIAISEIQDSYDTLRKMFQNIYSPFFPLKTMTISLYASYSLSPPSRSYLVTVLSLVVRRKTPSSVLRL